MDYMLFSNVIKAIKFSFLVPYSSHFDRIYLVEVRFLPGNTKIWWKVDLLLWNMYSFYIPTYAYAMFGDNQMKIISKILMESIAALINSNWIYSLTKPICIPSLVTISYTYAHTYR